MKNIKTINHEAEKIKFKILINNTLDNNYSFDNLNKNNGNRKFHNFIEETVGKDLTISEVDKKYKRTKGKKRQIKIGQAKYELIHYGKDNTAFRVFGYYKNGYFILTKIDPQHKFDKE